MVGSWHGVLVAVAVVLHILFTSAVGYLGPQRFLEAVAIVDFRVMEGRSCLLL